MDQAAQLSTEMSTDCTSQKQRRPRTTPVALQQLLFQKTTSPHAAPAKFLRATNPPSKWVHIWSPPRTVQSSLFQPWSNHPARALGYFPAGGAPFRSPDTTAKRFPRAARRPISGRGWRGPVPAAGGDGGAHTAGRGSRRGSKALPSVWRRAPASRPGPQSQAHGPGPSPPAPPGRAPAPPRPPRPPPS